MNQVGIVKDIDGNSAIITVKRTTACGENCAMCSVACNVNQIEIRANLIDNINIGDQVEVFNEDYSVLKYSLVLYGLPLLIMVITIFVVYAFDNSQGGQILAAVTGFMSLAVSFFILRLYEKMELKKRSFEYKILKKLVNE